MMSTAVVLLFIALLVLSASKASGTPWSAILFSRMPLLQAVSDWGARLTTFLMFVLVVGLIFYFVPNTKVRLRDVWPGAVLTAVLWRVAFEGFSWYSTLVRPRQRPRVDRHRRLVPDLDLHLGRDPALRRGVHGRLRPDPARAPRTRRAAERVVDRCPTDWRPRRARTCCSTPPTPWTGIPGARRRSPRARREDKPIFLSIGYSTCHWCHVMEHESFEDAGDCRHPQRALRPHQGGSRRASRRGPRLHAVRAGHHRVGRLADERVAHAGAQAVLRRARTFRRTSRYGRPGFAEVLAEIAGRGGRTARSVDAIAPT